MFFKKKEDPAESEGKEQKEAKKKTVAQCLNSKKSQNVEIFLNGCGINIDHVRRCVLDLDTSDKSLSVGPLVSERGTVQSISQEARGLCCLGEPESS